MAFNLPQRPQQSVTSQIAARPTVPQNALTQQPVQSYQPQKSALDIANASRGYSQPQVNQLPTVGGSRTNPTYNGLPATGATQYVGGQAVQGQTKPLNALTIANTGATTPAAPNALTGGYYDLLRQQGTQRQTQDSMGMEEYTDENGTIQYRQKTPVYEDVPGYYQDLQ